MGYKEDLSFYLFGGSGWGCQLCLQASPGGIVALGPAHEVSSQQKMAVAAGTSGENLISLPSEETKPLTPSVCGCMPVRTGSSTKNNRK